jgi:hypothetical protein
MPRPLKVFQTHIGFYDEVVAVPSMKAAAEAWGTNVRVFAQGFAKATQDPDAMRAALAQPGVILKRPHGTATPYKSAPDPIPQPKVTAAQKAKSAKAAQDRKKKEEAGRRARAAAERKAKKDAEAELTEIERQEAQLRDRRQKLQQKFQLRPVK